MANLIFSLNSTVPVFLMMVLGYLLNRMGRFDRAFADKINPFVFNAALPVLLFKDLSGSDFYSVWDTGFVLFCLFSSLISILVMIGISYFLKDKSIQAEFIQGGFRSSPGLLGVAFIQSIYGGSNATAASLLIIGAVPIYNIAAVVVLTLFKPEHGRLDKKLVQKTLTGVITNPLIIGVLIGLCWSLLKIPQPEIMKKTVSSFSAVATPLGLMALGASFDFKKAFAKLKPSLVCSFFKLFVFVGIFLPIAVWLGYRQDKLVAALIMLGGAATVSGFTMAKSMGHEGVLNASVVMLTTLLSAFTLTASLYILKSLGLI